MKTAEMLPQPIALLAGMARVRRIMQRAHRLPGLPLLTIGRRVHGRGGARAQAPELPWEAERMAVFAPAPDAVAAPASPPPGAAMPPAPMPRTNRMNSAPAAAGPAPAQPVIARPDLTRPNLTRPDLTRPDWARATRTQREPHPPVTTSPGPAAASAGGSRRPDPLFAGLMHVVPGWAMVAPRPAGLQLAGTTPDAPRRLPLPQARPPAPALPFAGLRWRPAVRPPQPGAAAALPPSPATPAPPAAGTGHVMPLQAPARSEPPPEPSSPWPAPVPRARHAQPARPDAERLAPLPWPALGSPAVNAGPARPDVELVAPHPWRAPPLAPQTPAADPAAAPLLVQRGQQAVPASLPTVIDMDDSLRRNVRHELDEVRAMVARIAERPAPPAPMQADTVDGEQARRLLGRMRVLMQEEQFRRGHIR